MWIPLQLAALLVLKQSNCHFTEPVSTIYHRPKLRVSKWFRTTNCLPCLFSSFTSVQEALLYGLCCLLHDVRQVWLKQRFFFFVKVNNPSKDSNDLWKGLVSISLHFNCFSVQSKSNFSLSNKTTTNCFLNLGSSYKYLLSGILLQKKCLGYLGSLLHGPILQLFLLLLQMIFF